MGTRVGGEAKMLKQLKIFLKRGTLSKYTHVLYLLLLVFIFQLSPSKNLATSLINNFLSERRKARRKNSLGFRIHVNKERMKDSQLP